VDQDIIWCDPGHIVLDEKPVTLWKEAYESLNMFRSLRMPLGSVCNYIGVMWWNGSIDQDATWYGDGKRKEKKKKQGEKRKEEKNERKEEVK